MLFLLLSEAERARAPEVRRRLIATLFGRASNVMMVALAAVVCGAAAFYRDGSRVSATIAACEVLMLVARALVILAFKHRNSGTAHDAEAWLLRFAVLAIGSSVSWGALCFVCLTFSHDPVLYVIPVLSTVGTAGAVAARNSGVPRLAKMQLAASLTPILAGCGFADDAGYLLLLILVPAMAAGLVTLIDERNRQVVDLIETQIELSLLSTTDALTQIPNRRCFDTRLNDALSLSETEAHPSALLMIDVDDFKRFNDRHGHIAGDALLCQIAAVLKDHVRSDRDFAARYGGEEFVVLLDGADLSCAAAFGETLRHAVTSRCSLSGGSGTTISIGVVAWTEAMLRDDVLNAADMALYRAKRAGRDRVEKAEPLDIAA